MNDQSEIVIDADRPEIRVPPPIQPVETHSWRAGINLQIERRRLDRLLLCAIEPREAVRKRVGNAELECQFTPSNARFGSPAVLPECRLLPASINPISTCEK